MSMTGERRRRVWRWLVIVWAPVVVAAGGLTLWMQDATEPQGPYVREQTRPEESIDPPPCPSADGTVVCMFSDEG
ncbi:hypothetical protein [Streptomyces sp. NPDC002788]